MILPTEIPNGESEKMSGRVDLPGGIAVLTFTVAEDGENASHTKALVVLTSSAQSPLEFTSAA